MLPPEVSFSWIFSPFDNPPPLGLPDRAVAQAGGEAWELLSETSEVNRGWTLNFQVSPAASPGQSDFFSS